MRVSRPTYHCEDDIHSLYDDTAICNANVNIMKGFRRQILCVPSPQSIRPFVQVRRLWPRITCSEQSKRFENNCYRQAEKEKKAKARKLELITLLEHGFSCIRE
jgi:hypothetical protein